MAVVNSRYEDVTGLNATAEVTDAAGNMHFSREQRIDVGADGVARIFTVPESAFDPASPIHFLDLKLQNSAGEQVSTNFYWISAKKTVYDWKARRRTVTHRR